MNPLVWVKPSRAANDGLVEVAAELHRYGGDDVPPAGAAMEDGSQGLSALIGSIDDLADEQPKSRVDQILQ